MMDPLLCVVTLLITLVPRNSLLRGKQVFFLRMQKNMNVSIVGVMTCRFQSIYTVIEYFNFDFVKSEEFFVWGGCQHWFLIRALKKHQCQLQWLGHCGVQFLCRSCSTHFPNSRIEVLLLVVNFVWVYFCPALIFSCWYYFCGGMFIWIDHEK